MASIPQFVQIPLLEVHQCIDCREWKPLTEFSPVRLNKFGVSGRCKVCRRPFNRASRQRHGDKWNAQERARYATDPSVTYRRKRAWQRKNPDKVAVANHRRRVRKAGNGGSYAAEEWQALCELYNQKCLACGSDGPLTVDHVIPLSLGGSNDITNIQPLCDRCNKVKQAKIIDYRP